jgi:predicted RecB family nuclease
MIDRDLDAWERLELASIGRDPLEGRRRRPPRRHQAPPGPHPHRCIGVDLAPIPRADVEVDVDMESINCDGGSYAYLWGTLTTVGGVSNYRPFVTWDPLSGASAARVFAEFWYWLIQLRDATLADGRTFMSYAWGNKSAENPKMRNAVNTGEPGLPRLSEVVHFHGSEHWVDLHIVAKRHIAPCPDLKLKTVEQLAGFHHRDPDPGGFQSVGWHRDATRHHDQSVRKTNQERLLAYNEDDVLGTLAVRNWLDHPAG